MIAWDQRLPRKGCSAQTLAETELTGSAIHLWMTARVTASEEKEKLCEWEETVDVPRDGEGTKKGRPKAARHP